MARHDVVLRKNKSGRTYAMCKTCDWISGSSDNAREANKARLDHITEHAGRPGTSSKSSMPWMGQ